MRGLHLRRRQRRGSELIAPLGCSRPGSAGLLLLELRRQLCIILGSLAGKLARRPVTTGTLAQQLAVTQRRLLLFMRSERVLLVPLVGVDKWERQQQQLLDLPLLLLALLRRCLRG